MIVSNSTINSLNKLKDSIYLLECVSPELAEISQPGQFFNIKINETLFPLLRRPFSICDIQGDSIFFMFEIHGEGTSQLAAKEKGETLDLIGPLGNGFELEGDYKTAVIIAGGIGAAPFPLLTKRLKDKKEILTFIGARDGNSISTYGLENYSISTDDGSVGFHGTVLQNFVNSLPDIDKSRIKIFACGPNAMLRELQKMVNHHDLDCQISTECAMACGFGICQGCPVESHNGDKYLLVCSDGPVFNAREIKL